MNFPRNLTPLCDERILSQGLLRNKDGKSEFLHMSYAEFFVSDYILMRLENPTESLNEMFFKILSNEKFENVRKFLRIEKFVKFP